MADQTAWDEYFVREDASWRCKKHQFMDAEGGLCPSCARYAYNASFGAGEEAGSAALRTFARRVTVATKHGPQGRGGEGKCSADCAKCEAERILAEST